MLYNALQLIIRILYMKFVLIVLSLLVFGCSVHINPDQPSAMLIRDGEELMAKKKYKFAATLFENAVYNAQNPDEAMLAQRYLADAYYSNKKYLDAIASYETYYYTYYDDTELSLILYRLGMSYSHISPKIKRDQAFTVEARNYFDELERMFPTDYRRYGADMERLKMTNKLAWNEYHVANYYYRTNAYDSAVPRLLYLVDTFPEASMVDEALVLLIRTSLKIPGRQMVVEEYLKELENKYPNNKDIEQLKKDIRKAYNMDKNNA